jgi:hypothetical protein
MHPGVHVTDVGHLQQEGIQPRADQHTAEDGFVCLRRTGGDHHAVDTLLLDFIFYLLLSVASAGEHLVGGINDIGQVPGVLYYLLHIDDTGDVAAAMADEYTHARDIDIDDGFDLWWFGPIALFDVGER